MSVGRVQRDTSHFEGALRTPHRHAAYSPRGKGPGCSSSERVEVALTSPAGMFSIREDVWILLHYGR